MGIHYTLFTDKFLESFDMTKIAIQIDPEIQGGALVFVGTRVPVKTLFDYLEAGDSLATFCEDFPSVPQKLCVAALVAPHDRLLRLYGEYLASIKIEIQAGTRRDNSGVGSG